MCGGISPAESGFGGEEGAYPVSAFLSLLPWSNLTASASGDIPLCILPESETLSFRRRWGRLYLRNPVASLLITATVEVNYSTSHSNRIKHHGSISRFYTMVSMFGHSVRDFTLYQIVVIEIT